MCREVEIHLISSVYDCIHDKKQILPRDMESFYPL